MKRPPVLLFVIYFIDYYFPALIYFRTRTLVIAGAEEPIAKRVISRRLEPASPALSIYACWASLTGASRSPLLTWSTFAAMANFNSSIPLPVTAEIENSSKFFFFA
jgi:hypothetical protein